MHQSNITTHTTHHSRKWLSALDAVESYYELVWIARGVSAFDCERAARQTAAVQNPEGVQADLISDIRALAHAFAHGRKKSSQTQWRAWHAARIDRVPLRDIPGTSRTTASRLITYVDGQIEQWLDGHGLLLFSEVPDERAADEVRAVRLAEASRESWVA